MIRVAVVVAVAYLAAQWEGVALIEALLMALIVTVVMMADDLKEKIDQLRDSRQ